MADLTRKTANLWTVYPNQTYRGVTFEFTNNTIKMNNTCTQEGNIQETIDLKAGTYTLAANANINISQNTHILQIYKQNVVQETISLSDMISGKVTFTIAEDTTDILIRIHIMNGVDYSGLEIQPMLNAGSTALPYEPYGWVHSLRKMSTATEAIQSGDTIYANGQPISTYSLKGNTTQSGTPTPANPVTVQGTGNKTANLFNVANVVQQPNIISISGTTITKADNTTYNIDIFSGASGASTAMSNKSLVLEAGTYTLSCDVVTGAANMFLIVVCPYTSATLEPVDKYFDGHNGKSFTLAEKSYVSFRIQQNTAVEVKDIMVTSGSQSPTSYIPYGYEIPILNGQTALTPVYLTEPLMKIGDTADSLASDGTVSYNIRKYVLTGNENWLLLESGTGSNEIYQFYTDGLTLGGIAYTSALSSIAPYGMTVNTRTSADFGVYLITSGTNIGFQMRGAKSSFADVTAWKTYLQQQYANGTPVTIWYILETPTTETVTAPSIPTTEGANTITVDTTVQPSEFTATWTGWHDSSVKEYDGSQWLCLERNNFRY